MIVMTLALLFQVRGGSALLGAGSTCTHQLAQMLAEATTDSPSCCIKDGAGETKKKKDVDRDCCAGGMTSPHCCLTVVPALGRVEVKPAQIVYHTLTIPHRDGIISMPSEPLLRPPILT